MPLTLGSVAEKEKPYEILDAKSFGQRIECASPADLLVDERAVDELWRTDPVGAEKPGDRPLSRHG